MGRGPYLYPAAPEFVYLAVVSGRVLRGGGMGAGPHAAARLPIAALQQPSPNDSRRPVWCIIPIEGCSTRRRYAQVLQRHQMIASMSRPQPV